MNRIVRRHFPASKLPDELREGLGTVERVTVTVAVEEDGIDVVSLGDLLAQRRPPFRSIEEIDESLRRDRDSWDD